MAEKPKGGKMYVYFREVDKNLYDEIMQEAKDRNLSPSRVLIGYLHQAALRQYDEKEMLCEKCKCQLEI